MANKSISQLTAAVAVNNDDLFETAQVDAQSASGYTSAKHSMAAIADHIAAGVVYPELETTAQTLVGAINEAAQTGGGGTTVVANPAGAATDTLDTVQIGETIYDIEGNAIEYTEYTIDALTNGTIDTSRGGCWYSVYGNVVHLHLSVKDLTAETTTNVFTLPVGLRPPHVSAMGIGVGASRDKRANVSIGAVSGACNLWSESTTALIDAEWMIDDSGSGSGGGSSVNYSTTEHAVGKWIDGSTVYEKTINTGVLPDNNSNDIAHGISNLGFVLRLDGFAVRPSDNTKLTLPHVNNANLNNQIQVMVVGNYIRITTKIDRTNFTTSYVTIQYTKTA